MPLVFAPMAPCSCPVIASTPAVLTACLCLPQAWGLPGSREAAALAMPSIEEALNRSLMNEEYAKYSRRQFSWVNTIP